MKHQSDVATLERELAEIKSADRTVKIGYNPSLTGYALAKQNRAQRTVHSSSAQHRMAKDVIDNCVC